MHCSLLSLGCAFGFSPPTEHQALTALRALKIAQRRLRPEVRNKLLSISSARTDQTLVPEAWRFVFLDPATSGNSRIVTVAAKTSSEHPDTIDSFSSTKMSNGAPSHPVPQNKLLVDSDQILEQIRSSSKLKGVRAAEYHLHQLKGNQEPVWNVHVYAENAETVIGKFRVGAKTGKLEQISPEKESRGA